MIFHSSGVSEEGCGVIIEGAAPIEEEAIATPPVGDTKASTFYHLLAVNTHTHLSSQSYSLLSQFGQYLYPIPLCFLAIVPMLVILNHFLFIFWDFFKVISYLSKYYFSGSCCWGWRWWWCGPFRWRDWRGEEGSWGTCCCCQGIWQKERVWVFWLIFMMLMLFLNMLKCLPPYLHSRWY